MTPVLVAVGCVLGAFLLVVLRGAPYVPTHRAQVRHALRMLDLPKGALVVDLGSGDGVVLKEAAKLGYRAVGFELNPILCIVAYLRCLPYRRHVRVEWRDFWMTHLPDDTDAVFVFLAGPYLHQLHQKLLDEQRRRRRPLKVTSYGFVIPGQAKPLRTEQAVHLYEYR